MIRFVALAASLLFLAAPALSDDMPKPNTLTPKEIADGWIMLFDGETTFGWKIEGEAKVRDGVLILAKGKKGVAYLTTSFGPHFDLSFELAGPAIVHLTNGWSSRPPMELKGWGTYRTTRNSDKVQISVPNRSHSFGGKRPSGSETSPFCIESEGDEEVRIRSVKLRPLGTKSLFNGKDLSGWKVFEDPKRNKSVFAVTQDGELSVKNGPGDLQTEKKFDNFVLQFDCKTNGKHLNSGIFFRCIENQYQNGYEAQIQNGFIGNDRTKPLDFGTGAIYRRVPARKVVSNDNEWFKMTVVANGPHIATWVNGYQTVDWTDERKPSDNPRQGLRTAAGHLSIQGHDPTTDLLFRNIRIAELKKK